MLPSVILEIEDLSIESITAVLPEEEELLPDEPKFPLPEADELEVKEPQLDFTLPQTGIPVYQYKEGKYLTAEAVLGTGTMNNFFSRISLYFLGEKPEGKILYQHETLDGFSSNAPGSGYNMREDRLESTLNFKLGRVELGAEGAFSDLERGLQGKGNFYTKINRFIDTGIESEYQMGKVFILKGSIEASTARQLLTAYTGSSEDTTEYYISPALGGEFQFQKGYFGISPAFSYRYVEEYSDLKKWSGTVKGYFGIDFSEGYSLEGSVGWYWSESSGHRVPFDLTLYTLISDFLSLRLGGGYKIIEYKLGDIFKEYPFGGIPLELNDNYGWFFDIRTNWIPSQGWIVDAGLLFMNNSDMPNFTETIDGNTGLFPFFQEAMKRLSTDLGVRWIISESFSARAGFETEILDKPEFFPLNRVTLDLNMVQKRV